MGTVKYTTIINKYPTNRDALFRGCWRWLESRRSDDGAEELWRVHNRLYDLKDFARKHPGGKEWILMTKGTDISESFESQHIFPKAKSVLEKYYVRDAKSPRNYRLTFKEDGFYQTLKRKVAAKLPNLDRNATSKSKQIFDYLLFGLCASSVATMWLSDNNILFQIMALVAGIFMSWTNTAAHNFIHQRNNWRMYGTNLALFNFRDWRVFHAMSHHPYPNSYADLEVSLYEPFQRWIPMKSKTFANILLSYFAIPLVYTSLSISTFLFRFGGLFFSETKVFYWDELLSLTLPLLMFVFGREPYTFDALLNVLSAWLLILLYGGLVYSVMALNAGHHGTKITHEGDEFKSLDFGLYQIAATIDRVEANSNLFVRLTHFGEHVLHHLFPSIDHALLPHFRKEFIETCIEFEQEIRMLTMVEAAVEQYKQLARREIIKLNK